DRALAEPGDSLVRVDLHEDIVGAVRAALVDDEGLQIGDLQVQGLGFFDRRGQQAFGGGQRRDAGRSRRGCARKKIASCHVFYQYSLSPNCMRRGSLSCEVTRPNEELSRFWLPVLNRVRLRGLDLFTISGRRDASGCEMAQPDLTSFPRGI